MSQKICQYDDRTGTKWCTRVPIPRNPYCPRPEGVTVMNPDGSYTVYPRKRCCPRWRHGCHCASPPTIYVKDTRTGYEEYLRHNTQDQEEECEDEIIEIIRIRRPNRGNTNDFSVPIDPFRLPY